ncbi:cytochrome C oxidase subunit IV family protein [Candidatus Saccharibacteria bacterium]|nr:cytochrome C oxidase subunit IV family protein [Candidatus Saccharibacteria bacterium]
MRKSDTTKKQNDVFKYVIGFLVCIILTIIPYSLVMNESLTGGKLLYVVLVFAFLQLFIQMFVFLHLGREKKPLYNTVFFASTFFIILIVVVGSIFIIDHLHYNMSPEDTTHYLAQRENISQVEGQETGACSELRQNHSVVIKDGEVSPIITDANLCDTLTITNNDDETREIAFGSHPSHDSYAGEEEISLRSGKSETITLSVEGTYSFHDHLDPDTYGYFIVSE